jgi:hypothetical protein
MRLVLRVIRSVSEVVLQAVAGTSGFIASADNTSVHPALNITVV